MKLGDAVRDTVTGFVGVAVARIERLKGATAIGVQSKQLHEGKVIEEWFEEGRLEAISAKELAKAA
jgi:hypothetical protein